MAGADLAASGTPPSGFCSSGLTWIDPWSSCIVASPESAAASTSSAVLLPVRQQIMKDDSIFVYLDDKVLSSLIVPPLACML